MNRRQALFALFGFGLGLRGTRESSAQSTAKASVIGLLDAGQRPEWWVAFRQQLRELGYVEGQNIAFETRFAGGRLDQLPALAGELVRHKVAVIVTSGGAAAEAAQQATSTIPIVTASGDEVSLGLVASLTRSEGNITGVTSLSAGLTGKRFQLLREVIPRTSPLAVFWHGVNLPSARVAQELEAPARSSKVALQLLAVGSGDEFTGAFSAMTRERARAVFVIAGPLFFGERRRISDLALKHRLPSIYPSSEYVEAGGLLSYGPSYSDLFRRAAVYVDKILKGAKPSDLPFEQPTKFELVINRKTARTLGVAIPRSIQLRADRVIE